MPCDSKEYKHEKGEGGAGGSPCKFRKREGTLADGRIVHGMNMKRESCENASVCKGDPHNFD